ncbi:MAG TPA: sensor histidine kinase [Actinocrinis sp.]|jgi:two-component system sensor histidine kinase DesK|uniref:sensor histidine kinase n=1 Tax=Actinocrinis sp. TaxID=1920516 RepID=UPI002DDD4736|nr:sensor histidine kinase [Actinocrinis sp.]HEV3171140.1 sensor histidine kinase [Actinocrinis sp.]
MADDELSTRPIIAGNRVGWIFAAIWLIYLAYPVGAMFDGTHRTGEIVGVLTLVAVYCLAYIALAKRNRTLMFVASNTALDRPRAILIGAIAAIATLTPIVSTNTWIVLWVYVSSACGSTLPIGKRNYALLGSAVSTGCMTVEAVVLGADAGLWTTMLLPSLFSGLGTIGIRRMQRLIAELRQARDEVKHLAANEERLRLARDLHDVAGHSLATVTLKAELARRLVKLDPDGAEKQVADIEQVSRQALADIREAVSGYRRPTLAVETASARTALEAAGITFDLDPALAAGARVPGLDPEAEAALAWCLREAVTNVVRHSGATRCSVQLIEARVDGDTTLTLEVTDDGDGGSAARLHTPVWGNGLTGLRERLEPFQATLRAAPVSPRGFKLTATLSVG